MSLKLSKRKRACLSLVGAGLTLLLLNAESNDLDRGMKHARSAQPALRRAPDAQPAAAAQNGAAPAAAPGGNDQRQGKATVDGVDVVDVADRPVMYTFFEIDSSDEVLPEGERNLVEAWTQAWSAAGWNARVLTMDHARRHPNYDDYDAILRSIPFSQFNKLCFWRWVAMAAVGGGWMTDLDAYPLVPAAEMGGPGGGAADPIGKLTIHSPAAVPCLISGSRSEWDRLAKEVFRSAKSHAQDEDWSDMFALQDLRESDPRIFETSRGVFPAEKLLDVFPFDREACVITKGRTAIHFSHYSIDFGLKIGAIEIMPGKDLKLIQNNRGIIARQLIEHLHHVCEGLGPDET